MNVKSTLSAVFRNKFVVLCGVVIMLIAIFLTASSFTRPSERALFVKRVNLAIRDLGHQLLLRAGDSTSRIMPVKELGEGVFLLQFENEFGFKPDTLISLTQRLLARTGLSDYTVTVYECLKPNIVYGFQVGKPGSSSLPCTGRTQPPGCYNIEIAFANFNTKTIDYASIGLILTGFLLCFSIVFVAKHFTTNTPALAKNKNEEASASNINLALPALGKFAFDVHHQRLLFGNEIIVLTDKECKVLELLNRNFGELTSREDLIQQVWVDEGVITGRSLDMFISKLRKKLSVDPELRITNVHGRGYRLEVIV